MSQTPLKHFAHESTNRGSAGSIENRLTTSQGTDRLCALISGRLQCRNLQMPLARQKLTKTLESQRNAKHKALFEAQDAVNRGRGALIVKTEAKLAQKTNPTTVIYFRWRLA